MRRAAILGSFLVMACGTDGEPPAEPVTVPPQTDEGGEQPAATEPVVAEVEVGTDTPPDVAGPPPGAEVTASGLASRVLRSGSGAAHPGPASRVTVHYSGWTTDGAMFDSSVSRGEPITFGLDQVIAGWTEGVQLMVKGEIRRLWIPEGLAYGGRPGRPQGMLVFDVELIEIEAP
jgi:peptidylprolyl isomerase